MYGWSYFNYNAKGLMVSMLQTYLFVSSVLFALGLFGVISRRNAVGMLIGIELILNAASLNFVAFSHFIVPFGDTKREAGQLVSLFVIILAACEAVVALAIVYALYRHYNSIDVEQIHTLKE